ncbi:penicillin-binding protein 1A [Xanthobacter oligotrophicus]|uniref:penicillin-binding protein 1A n=1 Tax=Xanthobacter oligotrophicus TaxID=2607286 RepID=UPI0011F27CF8|nr:penicillin-binding protein 1A [Xanthobacter oligotrophicus]MCG5234187.1 penicillin-binding protein 1A [Xanthobacter oligotrophicus]
MRLILRFLGFVFALTTVVLLAGAAGATYFVWKYSQDLPDYSQLQNYEPPVMTRVHAADGALVAEYAKQRRLYIPIQSVPKLVIEAFLSAEDKNFYEHGGIDPTGIFRAAAFYFQNYGKNVRPQGASTITQQVAKNFLLTNEVSLDRKVKEALLALRIERTYSKDRILELYLNEIYLGMGAYGIAAAALVYFDKSVDELNVQEVAYLAALPKAPSSYNPFRDRSRATDRRNWVIDRMVENGFVTPQEGEAAKKSALDVTPRATGAQIFAAEYYAEEVRRQIYERYGERKLYEGGLSVRTPLDPKLQVLAKKTLTDGLVRYDEERGWRKPVTHVDLSGGVDWGVKLGEIKELTDIPWRLAIVLDVGKDNARIGLQPPRTKSGARSTDREVGLIPVDGAKWTRRPLPQVLKPGDVIYVEPLGDRTGQWRLRQPPGVEGAMVVMEPTTGRVLAISGGFSYDESQFNRATQAMRQPGSSFKPLVYSAALDNGYTPSTIVMDAPFELEQQGQATWRPENYSGKFYGPQTLRFGLEQSRNVMTVRLANDVGMPIVAEYAKRFGIYDDMPPYLAMALGSGETTLMRMTGAYAMIANGGRKVTPSLIDRIQDRYGHTIFKHDERECRGCEADKWDNQPEPSLVDRRPVVLDPMTAYQITSMMEGVVQRGTGTALKELGKPIAGKTGTTNEEKDAWFIGFTPEIVVGVYLGYDKPKPMGKGSTGGLISAPIVRDFMKVAIADRPAIPFRVPAGIKLVRIDRKSGQRAGAGDSSILEAFKPGTAPPDGYSVAGYSGTDGSAPEPSAPVRTGGGLY